MIQYQFSKLQIIDNLP